MAPEDEGSKNRDFIVKDISNKSVKKCFVSEVVSHPVPEFKYLRYIKKYTLNNILKVVSKTFCSSRAIIICCRVITINNTRKNQANNASLPSRSFFRSKVSG